MYFLTCRKLHFSSYVFCLMCIGLFADIQTDQNGNIEDRILMGNLKCAYHIKLKLEFISVQGQEKNNLIYYLFVLQIFVHVHYTKNFESIYPN